MKTLGDIYQEAISLLERAARERDREAGEKAEELFHVILNAHPGEDVVLFHLATLLHYRGRNGLAIRLYESLQPALGNQPELWCNLGTCHKAEHRDEQARECWERALEIEKRPEYLANLASLHINQGRPEQGLEYAREAVELAPENPANAWNLALLLLELGEWDEGWRLYDSGIASANRPNRRYDPGNQIPYWMGDDLGSRTIVVYGEQGLGDEIMCSGFLPHLRERYPEARIILDCHERLESAFRRSFPWAEVHGTRKDEADWTQMTGPTVEWAREVQIDRRVGIHSLPRHFWGEIPLKPWLIPDPELVAEYRARMEALGPGPYIGIGWAAGGKSTHSHHRSFKLTPLTDIMRLPATWISVQYTEEAGDKLARHERNTGVKIHHWPEVVQAWRDGQKQPGFDYDHTLALLSALDLVVVPNTTAVHACGALGTECWSLTPDACAWRYRNGGDHMVMYGPHVTLYREDGDWGRTLDRLKRDLAAYIEARAAA